jgi:outer membrane protein assembly factor BamB
MWGHSASPLLIGDRLFVNIDGLVALEAATGKPIWRRGYNQVWGSCVHVRVGETDIVAVANGKFLRAADGVLLGRGMFLMNSSPLLVGNRMYYIQNPGDAIELPDAVGEKLVFKKLWQTTPNGQTHYASPVLHEGLLFTVSSQGILSVIDAKDGKIVAAKRLRAGLGSIFSSIALAGDYLYITGESGRTIVIKAGPDCEIVAANQLDRCLSTPVFHGERMYLRTFNYLYCIGR